MLSDVDLLVKAASPVVVDVGEDMVMEVMCCRCNSGLDVKAREDDVRRRLRQYSSVDGSDG